MPTEQINIVKLDDLLKGQSIDFIKMDIEGFEREAIQGMKQILKTCKYLIFEYSPSLHAYTHNLLDYLIQ
ncbi:MAG: FkbM family methyltransferase [Candidatus Peribacteria bacterium]|nr:FkbM family methyltransferase [Candidatus Peribacteria bacterium]